MNLYDLLDGLLTGVEKINGELTTGENWIQLGNFLIQWGQTPITATAGSTTNPGRGTATVTFPKAYSSAPFVWTTDTLSWSYLCSTAAYTITATGCNIGMISTRDSESAASVIWLAIGPA